MEGRAPLLLIVQGPRARRYSVEQFPFHIGRGAGCDLVLEDAQASRSHAILLREHAGVVLIDQNSFNGTWLNDQPVVRESVRTGDVIRIGSTEIVVGAGTAAEISHQTDEIVLTRAADEMDRTGSIVHGRGVSELAKSPPSDRAEIAALAVVYKVAQELSRVASKETLFQAARDFVNEIVESATVAVLADPDGNRARDFRVVLRDPGDTEPLSASVIEEAIVRRALVATRDTRAAGIAGRKKKKSVALERLRSVLCAPFFRGDELRLVCYVSHRELALTDQQVDLLSTVFAQTYLAFERLDAVERVIAYGREIAQKERLASVGKLVAVLAHEIRTPLTVARGEVELAQLEKASPPALERLDRALLALDRVTEIVGRTLGYAREVPASRSRLDLAKVVESALRLVEPELQHRCSVERRFFPAPQIFAEEAQVGQIVINLVRNAYEAFDPAGRENNRIIIDVRAEGADEARLTIADNGPGIPAEIRPRIFEAFFTTRQAHGTGLGLSICHDLVRDMYGSITFESAVGRGTVFTVMLPASGADIVEKTRSR